MIVAKAVIPNQYWILRQDDRKIGNIEAGPEGFQVKINNNVKTFKSITNLKQQADINFEPGVIPRRQKIKSNDSDQTVHGFPTPCKAYNAIFDVKQQVPLWTQKPKSKSWYAAGWYRVRQGRTWSVIMCPKLIMLERYEYKGPFRTEQEAKS